MQSIPELESRIRDFINSPRKQHSLLQDHADWNKLCSALDVVGDTELAIDAYLEKVKEPATHGELYLALYGILQVLFVQQDAVRHLVEALGLEYTPDPLLKILRKARNDSIGHPTERGRGIERSFNFIIRVSMSHSGFTLMTTYPDRDSQFTHINVLELVSDQRNILRKTLTRVIEQLREEEMEHRDQFREERLASIFPSTLRYYYEKIAETIHGGAPGELGAGFVDLVVDVIEKFTNALDERDIVHVDNMAYDLELVQYPLAELRRYFDNPDESKLNEKDAYIFLVFIRNQIDSLIELAREIDEKYATGI